MSQSFKLKEILNNRDWNKALSVIDSFYINSALASIYNKKNGEFINIRNCIYKFYNDIYENKIRLPEIIDDSWVSVSLSRYFENEIKLFESMKSEEKKYSGDLIIDHILTTMAASQVFVNYEGLNVSFDIESFNDAYYELEIVTTLRGKIISGFLLKGNELHFSGITAPSNDFHRYEVLTLQMFIKVKYHNSIINIILSKFRDGFSKIFIDNQTSSSILDFNDCHIKWGSFNIDRGV